MGKKQAKRKRPSDEKRAATEAALFWAESRSDPDQAWYMVCAAQGLRIFGRHADTMSVRAARAELADWLLLYAKRCKRAGIDPEVTRKGGNATFDALAWCFGDGPNFADTDAAFRYVRRRHLRGAYVPEVN